MRIALGADHRGAEVHKGLRSLLSDLGHEVIDHGSCEPNKPCDYPDQAYPVANEVAGGTADRGILIGGSGIVMSITANKVKGIRAAVVYDEISSVVSRRHNDANILCLSADMLGPRIIRRIVKTWLDTDFEGGRHVRRVGKITAVEQGLNPSQVENSDLEKRKADSQAPGTDFS